MYTKQSPVKVANGITITTATSAGQKTGLAKATPFYIWNTSTNLAFINTNNETASVTLSMPIEAHTISEFPIITSKTGTLNHISTGGAAVLTLIKYDSAGSA